MNLSRIGSQKVISADDTHITVLHLPGAHLNEIVTIETDTGETVTGHITSLSQDRCEIRLCDNHDLIHRDHLTIWRHHREADMSIKPTLTIQDSETESLSFITGVMPWDCLFPLNRGHRILVSAQRSQIADKAGITLIRAALRDGQIPVCSATRPTQKERERLLEFWQSQGLDEEHLLSAHSQTSAYSVLRMVHESVKKAAFLASTGHDVCLVITDVEAWFDLFCEDLTLQGRFLSRKGMVSAFHGELCQCLDTLADWSRQVTVVVIQPWQENEKNSLSLQELRTYFDVALFSLDDGSVSLDGEVMAPSLTQRQKEASLLRRQFKMLSRQVQQYLLEAEDLPDDLEEFQKNLNLFLSHYEVQEEVCENNEAAWRLLQGLHEDRLLRIPLSLLRDRISPFLAE